jgi:hypothetical protein
MSASDRVPIDTASRGRLRQWKRAATARFLRIEAVLAGRAFERAARDFNHKKGIGRQRALAKLRVLLAEARFEEAHVASDGFALWSYLHPRDSVICPGKGVGPAELQDCCTVDYLVLGRTFNHEQDRVGAGRGTGLWSVEVSDHALGRCLQRDPRAELDAVIYAAHRSALAVRRGPRAGFLLPAGNGAFVCSLRAGPDTSTGQPCTWVSARTWLHADQLVDDRHFAPRATVPAARLGASLLLPLALRHLSPAASGVRPLAVTACAAGRGGPRSKT